MNGSREERGENVTAYVVKWEGELRGPYALDAIAKLVERGVVTAETELQIDGQRRWVPAGQIPEVAALFAKPVPTTVMMPREVLRPNPPSRRAGLVKLALGVVIGVGVVATAAAVYALVTMMDPGQVFADEVLEQGLPSKVEQLMVLRLPSAEQVESVRGLRVSLLGSFCGGTDVGKRLQNAHGREPSALQTDGTLDLLGREGLREDLQCGERLMNALREPSLTLIDFEDDDTRRTVLLMPLSELRDPPFALSYNFSGLRGRCEPAEGEDAECDPEGSAAVRRGDWWALGGFPAIAAYAREWNRAEERSQTTSMEYAQLLAAQVDPRATGVLIQVQPEILPFAVYCSEVPGGLSECLPDEVADARGRIRANIRAVSLEVRAPSDEHFDAELGWTMSFATRDEADAEEVSRDLDELVRDWRAHLDNREPALVERIREGEGDDLDRQEVMLRAFIRAMSNAEIEVDGRVARLVAKDELSEAEQREIRAYLERQQRISVAASNVVLSLLAGEEPARNDLTSLVGEEAAGWMLEPRASREACDAIRAHLAELSGPGMPMEHFGAAFRVRQRYAEGSCAGAVLPETIRECLVSAATPTAMDECPVAVPPWQPQPLRQVHQGELTDDDDTFVSTGKPVDQYEVELHAGWTLTADLTSDAFDAHLFLLNPDGERVSLDDDGGGGTNARIRYAVPSDGTYTLRASTYSRRGRGPYQLTIRAE